jgi:hypothetical protein
MEPQQNTTKKLTKEEKLKLLTTIAEKFRGRDMFPEATERARNFLKNTKIIDNK